MSINSSARFIKSKTFAFVVRVSVLEGQGVTVLLQESKLRVAMTTEEGIALEYLWQSWYFSH